MARPATPFIDAAARKWEEIKYAKYLPPRAFGAFVYVCVHVCELFRGQKAASAPEVNCPIFPFVHPTGQWEEEVYKCRTNAGANGAHNTAGGAHPVGSNG